LTKRLRVWTEGNTINWFGDSFTGSVVDTEPQVRGNYGFNGDDYGVVLRLPNPASPEDLRAIVVFGSQTFGIIAATDWLVRRGSMSAVSALVPVSRLQMRSSNMAALVRARVRNGVIERSELIDYRPLDRDLAPAQWMTP
jgi:hypothetical protein